MVFFDIQISIITYGILFFVTKIYDKSKHDNQEILCRFFSVIFSGDNMAERPAHDQQHQPDVPLQTPTAPRGDMLVCLLALEAALLPCLPARELQAIDRSPHPSHQSK